MTMQISKISFGGATLGGVYGNIELKEAKLVVKEALEQGINLFDSSPYYGNSEYVLGKCLYELKHEYPREKYFISTKVGRYGEFNFDYSKDRIRNSIENSLKLFNTTYLDFVYCHDVEFVNQNQALEALEVLFELKELGKIKNVGISGYPLDVLINISQKSNELNRSLDCILSYCHYTLQNTLLLDGDYVNKFKTYNIKYIFNASPLSMGLLTNNHPPKWHPAKQDLKEAVLKVKAFCNQKQLDLADLATAFALSCPSQHLCSTIIGCINQQQVKNGIEILNKVKLGQFNNGRYSDVFDQCKKLFGDTFNATWPSPPINYVLK